MNKTSILPADFYKLPSEQRRKYLADNADEVQHERKVVRPLNGQEKDSAKEELIQTTITLANTQEEYDQVKQEWKERLDPLKKQKKALINLVRTGYEELTSDVFMIRDHENGRVYSLLPDGTLIDDRRMMEHERQATIPGNVRSMNSGT